MKPVSCKICASLGAKTKYLTLDDRKKHAQLHAIQSGYISEDGDQTSVKEIFGKCFPLDNFDKSENIKKSRSMLGKICRRIIKTNKNESNSIRCQICESNVQYVTKKSYLRTDVILTHACSHSTTKPFVCRECKHEMATKSNIVSHIKKIHKIDSPINGVHFDENWTDGIDEVKESLMKCFILNTPDPASIMKIQTPPSELSTQRRSIFSKILKNTNVGKKIQCRQCQVEICGISSRKLEDHIRFHLQQRIFECSMCDDTSFIYRRGISQHLVKKHSVPPKGNYIDHSDEHHAAILDWVKKCFGKE